MKYAVYSTTTGEIVRQVDCPPSAIEMQIQAGEGFVEGDVIWGRSYVSGGALLQYNDAQAALKSSPPHPRATWSNATFSWTDHRSLAEHQDAKWEEIKAARIAWFNAPLETPFGLFDCDGESRAYIQSAVAYLQGLAAVGEPGTVDFTLYDESVVTLDLEQMLAVGLALGARIQLGFNMAASLREDIYSATTIAQVQSISWG